MLNKTYFLLMILFLCLNLSAQKKRDSIKMEDLKPYTYHFDVVDGKITGDAKAFFEKEVALHQYVLLGEYHGSYRISEFTNALIPMLAAEDFNTFALEVGPISGKILAEFAEDAQSTTKQLHDFNSQYYVDEEGDYYCAIPFFEHQEDAQFLAQAATHNWNLLGLDQEFIYGYEPLIDRMYQNISTANQAKHSAFYKEVKDSLMAYYELEKSGDQDLAVLMHNSPLMKRYLATFSPLHSENTAIADAIVATTQIYYYNATRRYLDCNSTRIEYMKKNLRAGFERINFDLAKDKMLLKMGGIHTARGFSWLSLYEIGNTLNELANFHDNTSLHLSFQSRFYEEDGKMVDALDNPKSYGSRYKDFLQMAKSDQWTIIDLRPLKSKYFYARKYLTSDLIKDVFEQHDVIIVPKKDVEPSLNFTLRTP
ncbi:MAG: hypothetical protein AAGI49_02870 [Bacteroidota bacterium]